MFVRSLPLPLPTPWACASASNEPSFLCGQRCCWRGGGKGESAGMGDIISPSQILQLKHFLALT